MKCDKCIWRDICTYETENCDDFYNEKYTEYVAEIYYKNIIAENCSLYENDLD